MRDGLVKSNLMDLISWIRTANYHTKPLDRFYIFNPNVTSLQTGFKSGRENRKKKWTGRIFVELATAFYLMSKALIYCHFYQIEKILNFFSQTFLFCIMVDVTNEVKIKDRKLLAQMWNEQNILLRVGSYLLASFSPFFAGFLGVFLFA